MGFRDPLTSLPASSITAGQLGAGVTLPAGQIDPGPLADGVTLAAAAITAGNLDPSVIAQAIADGIVGATKLANGAVTTTALASNAVTATKIANATITATQLANFAVGSAQLANGAVIATTVAAGAIGTAALAAGAVTAGVLAAGAVVAGKIAAGAIDGMTITGALIRTAASGDRFEMQGGPNAAQLSMETEDSPSPGAIGSLSFAGSGGAGGTGTARPFVILAAPTMDATAKGASVELQSANDNAGGTNFAQIDLNADQINLNAPTAVRANNRPVLTGSRGVFSGATDANSLVTINHGLGVAPTSVQATVGSSAIRQLAKPIVTAINATQVQFLIVNTTNGASIPGNPIVLYWLCIV